MPAKIVSIVQLLCDLSESSDEVFRTSKIGPERDNGLQYLVELGAIEPGPRPESVACNACDADHPAVIEFDVERRCYVHFCPEAGFVTLNDADLKSHRFRPEWLVDWLATALSVPSATRSRMLVPGCVWHLGNAACGDALVTVIFARRVSSQATLDLLMSALRPLHPDDKGVVITTSPHVARQVQLPNGFKFLDLRDIAVSTASLAANEILGIRLESVTLNIAGTAEKAANATDGAAIPGSAGERIGLANATSSRNSTSRSAHGTVAQETELRKWLVSRMVATPMEPRPKATMQGIATDAGLKFSARAFERCWRIAVVESGASAWSAPGRKSSRRIDTPT